MISSNEEKPLIVAVDDDLTNLKILSFIIKKLDYRFLGVQNSTEAVPVLKENVPDLILLDILMSGMDGFELCMRIKEQPELNAIPVIFVTGKQEVEDKIKGLKLGGVDYITKPFNELELKARIQTHLDLASAKVKIERQAKKLAEDNLLLNRMFSIIGHDLRSPLSAIKMQLDFILRGDIDPHGENFLNKTVNNLSNTADEAFNLLDNLLGWAKSQSGVLFVIKEDLNLLTIAQQTGRLQKMALINKNIELYINIPDNAIVYADFNTIKTVFVNLVSNAVKFTPRDGKISIEVFDNQTGWETRISDTGIGMSKSQIKKVMDPTQHFSKTGTENESGTGLGLILCQDFLRKNDSALIIKSTKGEGSTFSFELEKFNPLIEV